METKKAEKIRISVDAVISVDNHILVCDVPDKSFTYLPGGGIEVGESIPEALHREMQEELRKDIVIGKYLGYIDQQFEMYEKIYQEVCHYFLVDLIGVQNTEPLEAYNEVLSVQWVSVDKLEEANLKPDVLRRKIPDVIYKRSNEIWHISQNEIE